MNPLDQIEVAITRQPLDSSRPPVQPEERVTLAQMLAAYTIAAPGPRARTETGSLTAGKAADIVVLTAISSLCRRARSTRFACWRRCSTARRSRAPNFAWPP
ncbi:MAG: hypothetical protein U1E87_07375 [Alphaproteobacteria bacterium]